MKERRNQLRHPQHRKPELLATAPKQVCSLDIARLLGQAKRTYFRLYIILDIFKLRGRLDGGRTRDGGAGKTADRR